MAEFRSRRTSRLEQMLRMIGLSCGGEPGARLANRLGMVVSGDGLLKLVRSGDLPTQSIAHVIGVDDWAYRRGQRYGTLICDLESHQPIDLLPDRAAETFEAWLLLHRDIKVIARDHSDLYARGATSGAPQAVQVADRWHLLRNISDVLRRLVDRHPDKSPMPGSPQFPEGMPQMPQCSFRPPLPRQRSRSATSATHGAARFMIEFTCSTSKESPSDRLLASWKWIEKQSSVICVQIRTQNALDLVAGRHLIRFDRYCGIVGVKDARTPQNSTVSWSQQVLLDPTTWLDGASVSGGRILRSPARFRRRRSHPYGVRPVVVLLGC